MMMTTTTGIIKLRKLKQPQKYKEEDGDNDEGGSRDNYGL